MKQPKTSPLEEMIQLARVVKTTQGTVRYKKPLGAPITSDAPKATPAVVPVPSKSSSSGSVTLVRVKSLREKLKQAKLTGNAAIEKKAEADFRAALIEYSKGKPAATVLAELGKK